MYVFVWLPIMYIILVNCHGLLTLVQNGLTQSKLIQIGGRRSSVVASRICCPESGWAPNSVTRRKKKSKQLTKGVKKHCVLDNS